MQLSPSPPFPWIQSLVNCGYRLIIIEIYIYIYDIDSCYIFFKLLDLSRSNGQKIYSLINTNILIRISFIISYLWHFILISKIKNWYTFSLLSPLSLSSIALTIADHGFLDFWLTLHFAGKCCPCIWRYQWTKSHFPLWQEINQELQILDKMA